MRTGDFGSDITGIGSFAIWDKPQLRNALVAARDTDAAVISDCSSKPWNMHDFQDLITGSYFKLLGDTHLYSEQSGPPPQDRCGN
jgi:hypothetical protein